jgi:hypothetical protein
MSTSISGRFPLIDDPLEYLWRIAVALAEKQSFRFSAKCGAILREQIKSGLEVHRVGRYEFKERCQEAEANLAKLIQQMIAEQLKSEPASRILQESALLKSLYTCKLSPSLWPFC